MKYLKKYENIDNIFDDWDDEEFDKDNKEILIEDIVSYMINVNDGVLTMADMEADSSPCLFNKDGIYHLVETLYENGVDVVVYGGYKGEQEIDDYRQKYEDLDKDILMEIRYLLKNYFENYEEDDY